MEQLTVINKVYSRNEAKGSVIDAFFREHIGINAPLMLNGYNAIFNVRMTMHIRSNYNSTRLNGQYIINVEKVVNGVNYPIYRESFWPEIEKVLGSQHFIKSLMREALHEEAENYYFNHAGGMATNAYYSSIGFEKGVVETLSRVGVV